MMKIFGAKFLCILGTFSLCVSAQAGTFTFEDWNLKGLYSYKFLAQGQSYFGTWDISDEPDWSTSLDITSITADFWFADDKDADTSTAFVKTGYYTYYYYCGKLYKKWVSTGGYYQTTTNTGNLEEVDIFVGGGSQQIADNLEVDGTINYYTNLVSYDLHSYDLSTYISILADIGADGILKYTVKAVKGDTYLKETRLIVVAQTPPSVPDTGSTLLLAGAALLGLVALRQRS